MKFQIRNSEGIALSMSELDKEASAFFGVEFNESHYAYPEGKRGFDWFNWIGCAIASFPKGHVLWNEVIGKISAMLAIGEITFEGYLDSLKSARELINLVIYWRDAKEYEAFSV